MDLAYYMFYTILKKFSECYFKGEYILTFCVIFVPYFLTIPISYKVLHLFCHNNYVCEATMGTIVILLFRGSLIRIYSVRLTTE